MEARWQGDHRVLVIYIFQSLGCLLKRLRFLFELARTSPNFRYGLTVLRVSSIPDL